ncbi:phage tail tape measure protein [Pasteurella multocida]|uniref:phage tail tape measure protein n=1 Tax=Pasteurella multocida TaxID=747 RepID=UPI00099A6276|nr:phage tail tape measure protein [Pasteurella multocida]ARA69452.1 phage tail tape measure protein [Pasteurella multocida subsp. multocida]MCL7777082.1 phage tail tape measure protein [Pasteurella multocida]MCL7802736.1 phage tail tape measure protein [Pasteurella multocida]OPC87074.1 phage tail tape measure protein [Pasteurella multocida subsp. multocida]OPC89527.1 phage tail tape measure protein [Pasteurella multocida subsp. septica]
MAVEGLEYVISLVDQVSAPLKGVMKSIDDIGNRGKDAMIKIGAGVGGIVAAGVALQGAIAPAIEMNRAIGEVRSLSVAEESLRKLTDTALEFSSQYGESATDFVRSSYDIQSSIAGLQGDELAEFTKASNLLAKGTKANASTITNYMGTMYGIFEEDAKAIGNANWVQEIAGKTALAVKMFKTSGDGMSAAFTSVGASAKSAKIGIAEQFAVLGTLQATMGGSEAGTKYKAFLAGVGNAQKALNLQFTDSNGNMLDMVSILNKIKGKFGDTLELAESDALKKAFGSDEAVALIKLLLPKVNNLKGSIQDLAKVKGMDDLEKMAQAMTDPWARFSQTLRNIKTAIGTEVLRVIEPIANKIADLGTNFVKWLSTYKNIARWIGYIVGALIGFTGFTAALTLMSGVVAAIGVAFSFLFSPIAAVITLISAIVVVVYKFRAELFGFIKGVVKGFKSVGVSFEPVAKAFGKLWDSLRIGQTIAWAFGLFGGATDSVDTFTSAGEKVGIFVGKSLEIVVSVIELIVTNIAEMADIFANVADFIIEMWDGVIKGWQESDPKQIFDALANGVGNIFSSIFNGIEKMFINTLNWLITQANKVSGVIGIEIPLIPVVEDSKPQSSFLQNAILTTRNATNNISATGNPQKTSGQVFALGSNTQPERTQIAGGSVSSKLTTNQNIDRSVNIHGGVVVKADDPSKFEQWMRDREQLNAG